MSEENEKWWEDYVEVRVNVVLPKKLVGDEWPHGLVVGYKQLIDPEFARPSLSGIIALEMDRISEIVKNRVQEEVERGTER